MLLVYGITGGYLIYFIQKNKVFDNFFIGKFLDDMRKCDLCLGAWVFLGLYPLFKITIFDGLLQIDYVLFIPALVISCIVVSTIVHYFRVGWSVMNDIQKL